MDELRLVRREDRALIVATDAGEEFRLIVDETLMMEVRQISRRPIEPNKASPREIQAMVRAGRSRRDIAEYFDIDESTVERYEEPVLAERRYILDRAQAVPVRATQQDGEEQVFGVVIAERLIGLSADNVRWSSWRDEEAGWMVGLEFDSHDIEHRAVWSFDHRRSILAPITSDASTLSKQGEVGDRLIPKLRAVDDPRHNDRFDSGAFDPEQLASDVENDENDDAPRQSPRVAPDHPSTGSIPIVSADDEALRRRNIEERAVKTPQPELQDLGQTADLLDALRRRRGERDSGFAPEEDASSDRVSPPVALPGMSEPELSDEPEASAESDAPQKDEADSTQNDARRGRRRPQIPSWDDILFGTRSEEDPS